MIELTGPVTTITNKREEVYTRATSKGRFQQGYKPPYLRHGILGLVILTQNFITKKMVAYSLALRVLS